MKAEFKECSMPMNRETISFLKKQGNFFFVKVREKTPYYNREKFRTETSVKNKITTLQFFPNNVVIYSHDFFREYENVTLVGYCPIDFGDDKDIVNL